MNEFYKFRSLLLCGLLSLAFIATAQDFRAIDGSNNNANHPEWGAAHTPLVRTSTNGYLDGISMPGGIDRPNPRLISNELFAQDGILSDPLELSDYVWVFGQFIDHDVTFVLDGDEAAMIDVPAGDKDFDPFQTGEVKILMHRSQVAEGSGTSPSNPRNHPNVITSFLDASAVYGSEEDQAAWLRSFEGGKLKVSAGNLLPFNTITGELDSEIDEDAPHMEDPVGLTEKLFVAGDARANENPLLLSFQTLFVREHNRICEELIAMNPDWDDETLYQYARKMVGALLQSVVYNEWLPAMGIELAPYEGYDPEVNPGVTNLFSAAAFRLGHTLLNGNLLRLDKDGNSLPDGPLELRSSFFNVMVVYEDGIDPYFQGMAAQIQQSMDAKVVDDIRNFLFGPPGAGGLDLASININRGRERGLPDFNTIREDLGLEKYVFFIQISAIPTVFTTLREVYKDINRIDPWVGMLAEAPMPGSLFGETITAAMQQQFTALRDGDRFFFENDPALSEEMKAQIRATKMVDIVKRNTTISLMQENVFKATPPSNICGTTDVQGIVHTEDHQPLDLVNITLTDIDTDEILTGETDSEGIFSFEQLDGCRNYKVAANRSIDDWTDGVSTLDLLVLQKHILNVTPLDSPYKIIAADANGSGRISTMDLVSIRKVILGIDEAFPVGTSWRFIDGAYEFENPADPLGEDFDILMAQSIGSRALDVIAVKVGDLNNSIQITNFEDIEQRSDKVLVLDAAVTATGNIQSVQLSLEEVQLQGLQLALSWNNQARLLDWQAGDLPALSNSNFYQKANMLTMSWNTSNTVALQQQQSLVTLNFEVEAGVNVLDLLTIDNEQLNAQAYFPAVGEVLLNRIDQRNTPELYQNQPNPFQDQTMVRFYLTQSEEVTLTFSDISGKVLHTIQNNFGAGQNQVLINRSDLSTEDQIINYSLKIGETIISKQMLLSK